MRRSPQNKKYLADFARTFNGKWIALKSKINVFKFDFSLTFEECEKLWSKGCEYCGKSLEGSTGVGLDRVDSSKGYTLDNVVPCCGPCNKIKNVYLSHEEMKVAMKAVLELRNT